jgi:CRISPR/Cas system-associated endonuclease Cas3-HD
VNKQHPSLVPVDPIKEIKEYARKIAPDVIKEALEDRIENQQLLKHRINEQLDNFDNILSNLTDIKAYLNKLSDNAQKESEVLDLLKQELTK